MKTDICLVACDLNPTYIDFYPLVKKFWFEKTNIQTKLILISDFIPDQLISFKDDIILFHPIENIPTPFQAQCIRILYPSLLNQYENGIILSDMDLIPMNNDFYIKNIENVNDNDTFVVYRNVIEEHKQYPICFCNATSKIWKEIFQINNTQDIIHTLSNWYFNLPVNDYKLSDPFSIGWAMDQLKLFEYVNKWNGKKLLLNDYNNGFNRLDRNDISKTNIQKIKENIKNNIYSDFHLLRPYSIYKNILDFLLD